METARDLQRAASSASSAVGTLHASQLQLKTTKQNTLCLMQSKAFSSTFVFSHCCGLLGNCDSRQPRVIHSNQTVKPFPRNGKVKRLEITKHSCYNLCIPNVKQRLKPMWDPTTEILSTRMCGILYSK